MAKKKKTKKAVTEEGTDLVPFRKSTIPAALADVQAEGLESRGESSLQSRIKIVQSQTDAEVKEEYGEGAVILPTDKIKLVDLAPKTKAQPKISAVPIFRWPTWGKCADYNAGGDQMILEESPDPTSILAQRSKNPAQRREPYPDRPDLYYDFVELRNWIFLLLDGDAAGRLVVYSWWKGGMRIAQRLYDHVRRPKGPNIEQARQLPIYGHGISLFPARQKNAKGNWYDLEFVPSEPMLIGSPAIVRKAQQLHREAKAAYESAGGLKVEPAAQSAEDSASGGNQL